MPKSFGGHLLSNKFRTFPVKIFHTPNLFPFKPWPSTTLILSYDALPKKTCPQQPPQEIKQKSTKTTTTTTTITTTTQPPPPPQQQQLQQLQQQELPHCQRHGRPVRPRYIPADRPVGGGRVGGISNSLGRDRVVAEYEAHLRRSGLPPNTPVNVSFTPVRAVSPFHATGPAAWRMPNLWSRGRGRRGGVSGPASVASGRGGGVSGPGSVVSGRGGGISGGVTGQGRGGGAAGSLGIGQGRGGAATGGVIGGRVGDQGHSGRGGGASGGGWGRRGRHPGVVTALQISRDAVVEGEPQDRREVAEAVEGRSEDEADIMEEMEGELGDDSSMGETAVGQPGSVYEGLKDQRARGEEEQEPEGEHEALRRELDRLRQKEVAREE